MKKIYLNPIPNLLLVIILIGGGFSSLLSQNGWERLKDCSVPRGYYQSCIIEDKIYIMGGASKGPDELIASTEVYDITANDWTILQNTPRFRIAGTAETVNGKVYAIGGLYDFQSVDNTNVEEYDPATDSWSTKGNMPELRWNHTSCVYNNKIYLFGGGEIPDPSIPHNSARVYDPETNEWDSIAWMKYQRDLATCNLYKGKIFVFGGLNSFDEDPINKVEVYDPETDTWQELAEMPFGLCAHSSVVYKDKIILFGGAKKGTQFFDLPPVSSVLSYDPETDKWQQMEDMPFNRKFAGEGIIKNNYVYIIGGSDTLQRNISISEAWRLNLDSLKPKPPCYKGWERMKDMPIASWAHSGCLYNNKVYIIGGGTGGGFEKTMASTQIYDLARDQWSIGANMPERGAFFPSVVYDNKIYTFGGFNNYPALYAHLKVYDPDIDKWSVESDLPDTRWGMSSCSINNQIYLFGGYNGEVSFSSNWLYNPETDTWDSIPSMKSSRMGASTCLYDHEIFLFGGCSFPGKMELNEVLVFNPKTKQWREKSKMPDGFFSSIPVSYEEKIILFGGDGCSGDLDLLTTIFAYNPSDDKWFKATDNMPFIRGFPAGIPVDNYIYLFGGLFAPHRDSVTSEVWRFNLDSMEFEEVPAGLTHTVKRQSNRFILQNHPNPFTGSTIITFDIDITCKVNIEIYNCLGQKIITLINEVHEPGSHKIRWATEGHRPGLYFCRLKAGNVDHTIKLILTQ